MCRRFRRDFCFGHRGLLSSFRRIGYRCRRRWTISVTRFLMTRYRMHNVNRFWGRIPQCHCRCIHCRLDPLICRGSLRFRLCWPRGPPLVRRWGSSAIAPPMDMEDKPVAGDGPAGLSESVHVVQWTTIFGWESSVWLAASSPAIPGVRRCAGVGSPIVPFTNVLGRSAWRGTSDGSCHQPVAGRGYNVVQSSDNVAVRHVAAPHVIRNDGPRHRTDGVSSGRGR